jgi:hypothetical protein
LRKIINCDFWEKSIAYAMSETIDLRMFVRHALEESGCVLEDARDGFQALLSPAAAEALLPLARQSRGERGGEAPLVAVRFLRDETDGHASAPALHMAYGSEALRALTALLERSGGTATAHVESVYLPRGNLEDKIRAALEWVKLKPIFLSSEEALHSYLLAHWRYRAVSDDRREGLVTLGVSEQSGAVVPDLDTRLEGQRALVDDRFSERAAQCTPRMDLAENLGRCGRAAEAMARERLGEFSASMARRRDRDLRRIDEYYDAMAREIEAFIARRHLTDDERIKHGEKIAIVRREQEAKRGDIASKYVTVVTLSLGAAERIFVRVVVSRVRVLRGRDEREISLVWNPLTKALDPLPCSRCGSGMFLVSACERWHWLCPSCRSPCERCGSAKLCRVCTSQCQRCVQPQR